MTRKLKRGRTSPDSRTPDSPLRGKWAIAIGLALATIIVAAILWPSNRDENGSASTDSPGDQLSVPPPMPRTARELVVSRQHYDETVWGDEVQAQRYESTFVKLWDDLNFKGDKYKVLQDFAFDKLIVGRKLITQQLDWGIESSTFGDEVREIPATDWPHVLSKLQAAGYKIIETEWHHQKFEPAQVDRPARSVVSVLLHVEHPPTTQRFVVKGNLKIEWTAAPRFESSAADPSDRTFVAAKAGTIDATEVKVIHRKGEPAFRQQILKEYDCDPTGKIFPTTIHPVILHDLNHDGLPEVVIGGYNLVYWNQGDWKFKPAKLHVDQRNFHPNAGVFADFTGDGVTDYLCGIKNGFPHLFVGTPGGKFPSPGKELKISEEKLLSPTGMAAGDIDGDGDLDVFIGQQKPGYQNGDIPTPYYDANDSYPSYLLLNDGTGQFRDVTAEAGLGQKNRRRNFSATFVDLDDDDDLDLMLTSDFSGADLFYNDGRGNFTDVTHKLRPRGYAFGMSHTFGDYNLDGHLDFMVVGMSSTTARRLERLNLGRAEFPDYNKARMQMGYGNRMYLYDGENFVQAPFNASVARTGWSWGSTTLDFDCDGDQDLYVVNGQTSGKTTQDYCTRFWCHDVYYKRGERPDKAIRELFGKLAPLFSGNSISWNGFEHNALLMNLEGEDYLNVGYLMDVAYEFDSRCAVSGDLDGDGRVDILVEHKDVRNNKSNLYFVRNQWTHANHWIGVHLRQDGPSPSPLGAKVTVQLTDGRKLLQHNLSGHSVWAQHANTVHFGLGKSAKVEAILVRWPDGTVSELREPGVDQYHTLRPVGES